MAMLLYREGLRTLRMSVMVEVDGMPPREVAVATTDLLHSLLSKIHSCCELRHCIADYDVIAHVDPSVSLVPAADSTQTAEDVGLACVGECIQLRLKGIVLACDMADRAAQSIEEGDAVSAEDIVTALLSVSNLFFSLPKDEVPRLATHVGTTGWPARCLGFLSTDLTEDTQEAAAAVLAAYLWARPRPHFGKDWDEMDSAVSPLVRLLRPGTGCAVQSQAIAALENLLKHGGSTTRRLAADQGICTALAGVADAAADSHILKSAIRTLAAVFTTTVNARTPAPDERDAVTALHACISVLDTDSECPVTTDPARSALICLFQICCQGAYEVSEQLVPLGLPRHIARLAGICKARDARTAMLLLHLVNVCHGAGGSQMLFDAGLLDSLPKLVDADPRTGVDILEEFACGDAGVSSAVWAAPGVLEALARLLCARNTSALAVLAHFGGLVNSADPPLLSADVFTTRCVASGCFDAVVGWFLDVDAAPCKCVVDTLAAVIKAAQRAASFQEPFTRVFVAQGGYARITELRGPPELAEVSELHHLLTHGPLALCS